MHPGYSKVCSFHEYKSVKTHIYWSDQSIVSQRYILLGTQNDRHGEGNKIK